MTLKMIAPNSEAGEPWCGGIQPAAHNGPRPAGALRDWRGMKYHLSSTTDAELLNVLAHAQRSHEDIERFVAELQAEWARRRLLET